MKQKLTQNMKDTLSRTAIILTFYVTVGLVVFIFTIVNNLQ